MVGKFGRLISDVVDMETEFVDLADNEIRPCLNCDERWEIPNKGAPWKGTETPPFGCIIRNDYLAKEVLPKIAQSDGLILGVPVSNLCFNSKFKQLWERIDALIWTGHLTLKPAIGIAIAQMGVGGGSETCLEDLNTSFRSVEMLPAAWLNGPVVTRGSMYELYPSTEEKSIKKDRYGQWTVATNSRRVAELTVLIKLGKRQLGDVYEREFVQVYHPPHGDEHWSWHRLDKEDEESIMNL